MRIELARPGQADNGQWVTPEDLQEIAETFGDVGEAPITIGHPTTDTSPRFGSVKSVAIEDGDNGPVLMAEVELHDAMAAAHEEGFFTKWSLGAKRRPQDKKRYLHHLAFLGGTPPAIKQLKTLRDLGTVELADDKDLTVFTFSDPQPDSDMGAAKDKAAKQPSPATPANPEADSAPTEDLALADQVTSLKAEVQRSRERQRKTQLGALEKAMAGRLPKPAQDDLLALADQVASTLDDDTITLSDSDGHERKESFLDALAAVVEQIPQPVQPGELNLGDLGTAEEPIDTSKLLSVM